MADYNTRSLAVQTLLTTTHDAILNSGVVEDNIFTAHPVLNFLRSAGKVKIIDGGYEIKQGLMYGKNSTAGWYSGYTLIDVTAQEGVTAATYTWKQAAVSIVYSGRELRQNKGKAKIEDLVKTKQAQAELSLADLIATGLESDGTGTGSTQLTGYAAMHETTPGTTAYAGIPTTNTAWRNQASAAIGATAVGLLTNMRTVYNDCSQGKGSAATRPDFCWTTQAIHEVYESLMAPLIRYNRTDKADLSFSGLEFRGIPVEWTDYTATGMLHFMNSRHDALVVHKDANFAMLNDFVKPANQDGYVGIAGFMGALVTNNRRKGGKLAGLT